jgi:enoyl-CoA hydratase
VEAHDDGVTLITINRPESYNAANDRLHHELGQVWLDVASDSETRVAVVTGAGKAFSAGGDLDMVAGQVRDFQKIARVNKEAADIVHNMINCDKPIISAINGVAVGAGLAVAIMADISIAANDARLTDGHVKIGVAAGDHAPIAWPLLCGMAKAKYYLLTSEFITGQEAERIGLVSKAVPRDDVVSSALEVAGQLGRGPQHAIRWTKRSMNHWYRQAAPIFEAALAHEMLNFFDDDVVEGIDAVRSKRQPNFPSAQN